MPKMKTTRAAAKRFKKTASGKWKSGRRSLRLRQPGKWKRRHAFKTHILNKKPTKRLRKLRKPALIAKADIKLVERMLPY